MDSRIQDNLASAKSLLHDHPTMKRDSQARARQTMVASAILVSQTMRMSVAMPANPIDYTLPTVRLHRHQPLPLHPTTPPPGAPFRMSA